MSNEEKQRVDRWLYFARVVKSRSLAAKLANGGRVRVNRQKIDQASQQVRIGDVLTIRLDRRVIVYRVLALGERRGPASEARTLYEDLSPPEAPGRSTMPEAAQRAPGSGRPTKKQRRALNRLLLK